MSAEAGKTFTVAGGAVNIQGVYLDESLKVDGAKEFRGLLQFRDEYVSRSPVGEGGIFSREEGPSMERRELGITHFRSSDISARSYWLTNDGQESLNSSAPLSN